MPDEETRDTIIQDNRTGKANIGRQKKLFHEEQFVSKDIITFNNKIVKRTKHNNLE